MEVAHSAIVLVPRAGMDEGKVGQARGGKFIDNTVLDWGYRLRFVYE